MPKEGDLLRVKDRQALIRGSERLTLEELAAAAKKKSHTQDRPDYRLVKAVVKREKEEVIKALDEGADIDHQGSSGLTPLMWACQNAPIDIVELLLDRGADINLKDFSKMTALDIAMRDMNLGLVDMLKSRGAKSGSEIG